MFSKTSGMCLDKYSLDPAHYYSSPGLSWDALLKKTGVEFELLTDQDRSDFHREWNERKHLNGEQALREGEQPAGQRI